MNGYAWGPERKTYLEGSQVETVTLNSIVDAGVGDERNFVRVREADTLMPRMDAIEIEPGKSYEVYIYFRNDASRAAASGLRVQSYFSQVIDNEHWGTVAAALTAEGAEPAKVWDTAKFVYNGDSTIEMRYVNNTAVVRNSGALNEKDLPAGLFRSGGTLLGYNKLNGVLPAGAEYAGYITYEVRAMETTRVDFGATYGEVFATNNPATGAMSGGAGGTSGAGGGTGVGGGSDTGDVGTLGAESGEKLPQTGITGGAVMAALACGLMVSLAWGISEVVLRKKRKCDKIEG